MKTEPTAAQRLVFNRLLIAVCSDYGADPAAVTSSSRTRTTAAARDALCMVLHSAGISQPVIGYLLGRDHSTISNALRRHDAQDWRARRTIEREIDRLERTLAALKKLLVST